MNIGYINAFGNYPPTVGSSVHIYQITSRLLKRGFAIHSLGGYPHPSFKRYNKSQVLKFIRDIDVLYMRINGSWRWDTYSLLKLIRPLSLPLIWEVNTPADEMNFRFPPSIETRWKFFARFTNAAICVSEELQQYAKKTLGIEKSFVVPNGSDPKIFNPERGNNNLFPWSDRNTIKILWAGSARYRWQGVNIIPEIAKKFLKIDKRIKFVLIANRDYINFPVEENMLVMDEVPYLSMPNYIASCDICLCLYHQFDWSRIGFYCSPLKLFDYMACAKPVIASSMGQIERVINDGENGLLTDNSVDDIVEKILFLIKNRDKANEIGKAAREEIINSYNWDRAVQQTIDVLKIVTSGKNRK